MPAGPSMFGLGDRTALGGFATPGPANPTTDLALSALGQVMPSQTNSTVALRKLEQAFDLAHKLLMAALPQLTQWNPKAAKDAHAAARMLLNIKGDLAQESEIGPPPDLMGGFGLAGTPGPMGPAAMSNLGPGM